MSENSGQTKGMALSEAQAAHQVRIFRALIINLVLVLKEPMTASCWGTNEVKVSENDKNLPMKAIFQTTMESVLPTRKEVGEMLLEEESWPNSQLSDIHAEAIEAANVLLKTLLGLPKDLAI